jgi:hypothetical protein
MRRGYEAIMLIGLLAVLGAVLYLNFRPSRTAADVSFTEGRFAPVNVDNPALRLDLLKRFLRLEYKGVHRNIFTASAAPPPPPVSSRPAVNAAPAVPAGPPPLSVDAKYFGYVSDPAGNHRRGFFSTNKDEDVFIAGEGDTLMGRFRVVRLTNTAADVEEISSGRRATLTLEQPSPNG